MQRIAVSVFTFFIVLPALADARLPVVNLAAGSVSARAAFGEEITAPAAQPVATVKKSAETNEIKKTKKTVVARCAKKTAPVANVSADRGEQIVARADVLVPRKPSSDLWARNDAPLRLPTPDEFSVIRADYELPEEDLDAAAKPRTVARANIAPVAEPVAAVQSQPMSEIDTQIARLNELQRRADNSVNVASSAPARTVAQRAPVPTQNTSHPRNEDKIASVRTQTNDDAVSVSRMVVPMESDVIVRAVEKSESPRIASVRDDMTKMSPTELRKAFRKTFLSENKHLSAYQIDDRFDVASDMSTTMEGFTAKRDLSETGGIRPLEIKIKFRNDDSALSRDNYNLLTEYAGIVLANPTRAIQVSIPQSATVSKDDRKLAARRLAIVEQVLRDTGVSEHRIMPVLSQRDEEGFVLRMISSDQYETLTQKRRDMFGDTVGRKTYKSMSW